MPIKSASSHQSPVSLDNARVEVEEDGVYRITKRSLTGEGIYTRWFYPEDGELDGGRKKDMMAFIELNRKEMPVVKCTPLDTRIDGTLSAVSAPKTIPGVAVTPSGGDGLQDYGEHVDSDATEIIDEEEGVENLSRLKLTNEEFLLDFPYERIMKKISQEPTLILGEDI